MARLVLKGRRFEWPCERRDAHGPHEVEKHRDGNGNLKPGRECPGVPAHPLTQIGGSYRLGEF